MVPSGTCIGIGGHSTTLGMGDAREPKARETTMKIAKNAALTNKINSAPLYTIDDVDRVVHFVGSPKEWPYCEERLRAAKIVGIDSETRPVFHGKQKSNPCSLLQLAVRCAKGKREVFVIDLLKLQPKVYNAAISKLFLSKHIIKLGQGLLSDLKDLVASYPAASCFSVAKAVVEVNDLSISLAGSHHAISLQKLAYFYINKRLTKTMQTSNWNRRPLSAGQLHYAASDALVLIDIYDELMKRLQVQTGGRFKVESVMNVLDVHVGASLKCTLCFEVHDTSADLKLHRKECVKTVRSLVVCATCDEMLLLDTTAMGVHTSKCGQTLDDDEIDSPVEVSDVGLAAAKVKNQRDTGSRKRPRLSSTNTVEEQCSTSILTGAVVNGSNDDPAQRKRLKKKKKKSKKAKHSFDGASVLNTTPSTPPLSFTTKRVRKMSAGTLLHADDIWSEISSNLVSDQPSP